MAKVKSSLWSISNDPVPLQHVKVSGRVDDLLGSFTITQTYVTRKGKPQDCLFQFLLFDIGIVTGFKATFAGATVGTECLLKTNSKLTQPHHQLLKTHSDPSSTDTFIAKLDQVPPETTVQFHISFLQNLRLDRGSPCFVLPTTISPKTYFHEENEQQSSLRQFAFELDVAVKMTHSRVIQNIRSPSHPVKFTTSSPSEAHISVVDGDLADLDLVIYVDLKESIKNSLPQSVIENHPDRDIVMLTLCPHFNVPTVVVKDDDEEGHPDPREVLVAIDPNHSTLQEVLVVLRAMLDHIDPQIYFNFILLSKNITKMFHKSGPGFQKEIGQAKKYIESEAFAEAFKSAQAEKQTLTSTIKPVFDIDCVSEDVPRMMFIISKGHISRPATLFEIIGDEKGFSVFSLGLGVSSNYFVLNTMANTGACEVIYSSSDEEYAKEASEKIKRQIDRINQPNFDKGIVDWGNLTKSMVEQSPSKDLPFHFWNDDILTVFGVAEKPPRNPWNVEIKVESKRIGNIAPFKVVAEPAKDTLPKGSKHIEQFQLKRERDQPDQTQHVRIKKLHELAATSGVASSATVFFAQQEQKGINVTLISASDTFMDDEETTKPAVIKYDRSTLLKFQPHNIEKPVGAELGEAERGKEMGQRSSARVRGGGGRGVRKQQPATTRSKKLAVATQWESSLLDEFFRSVNSLLNKMSKENYENLKTKLLAMKSQIEAEFDALDVVVKLVFEKALISPRYAPLYADLCQVLANEIKQEFEKEGKQVNFRVLLLHHCRENFEKCFTEVTPAAEEGAAPKVLTDEEQNDISEKEFRRRARLGANIAFVGELFLRGLLRAQITHIIIRSLLEEDRQANLGSPDGPQLELACKMFATLGQRLEQEDSKAQTDRYFLHLETLVTSDKYDKRTKFMIGDLLTLRKEGWASKKQAPATPASPAKSVQLPRSPPSSPGGNRANKDRRDDRRPYNDGGRGDGGRGRGRGGDSRRDSDRRDDRRDSGRGSNAPRGTQTPAATPAPASNDQWQTQRGGKPKTGGGRDSYTPAQKNAPTGSSRVDSRPDHRDPRSRGSNPPQVGRGAPVNKNDGGGFQSRGGGRGGKKFETQGGGRGGNSRDVVSNPFAALNNESDGEASQPSSPATSAPPSAPTTPVKYQPKAYQQQSSAPSREAPAPTPAAPAAAAGPQLSSGEVEKKLTSLFNEYLNTEDPEDAASSFKEITSSTAGYKFVKLVTQKATDGKPKDAVNFQKLLKQLIVDRLISSMDVFSGFLESVPYVEDVSCDYPFAAGHFGILVGEGLVNNVLTTDQIKEIFGGLSSSPKVAAKVAIEILKNPNVESFGDAKEYLTQTSTTS